MALKKQSIRKNMTILVDRNVISKEELITMSTLWTESQEKFFRKMLKQGGKFTIQGKEFEVKRTENKWRNSKGEFESAAKPHNPDQWK